MVTPAACGAGTTRAPCTGPLATRTVRHTPAPASSAPTSTADVDRGAQERAGRARSRTRSRPARRPRHRPAASGADPGRGSATRAAGRCPAAAQGRRGRRRPGRPARARDPPAAAAGCRSSDSRSRSISANTAGVDRPPSANASTQWNVFLASTVASSSPRPVPSAVPPCSANGTSLPSRAASACRSRRGTPSSHNELIATSTAAASALPPAMPPGDRDRLLDGDRDVGCPADVLGHQFGGPPRQVALVGGQRLDALPRQLQRQHVGVADGDLVEQRNRVENGRQLVIAVVAAIADGQIQVDFARHPHGDRPGGNPLGGGTAVGHGTTLAPTRRTTSSQAVRKAAGRRT